MRRYFNENERQILYQMANGRCQKCGTELYGVFHADHIKPFAKGGKTDVINGQVLCGECNMKKSDHYEWAVEEWPLELRDWQQNALLHYMSEPKQDFLAVATPGAGKTVFCLRVAHLLLSDDIVDQIAIVVPSDNLKTQWAAEAAQVGINIQTSYDASISLAPDMHGIVTTYQAVAARNDTAKSYRIYTARKRTFVIFDEIHHAGDGLTWGDSIRIGFEFAIRRLSVTGTPFRSDSKEIPFVEYQTIQGEQISKSDYTYGYGDALRDNVVRHVFFQTYDGDISWLSGDEIITATFSDHLGSGRSRERLRAAISTKGDWLHKVLQDAHNRLMEVRQNHPSAGGLVIAKDIYHAKQIAQKLAKISNTPVALSTSDNEEGNEIIDRFRQSNDEWIVAVKMVSEGVDIKRLRIGVYATNVTTELFFRQAVGRVVRMVEDVEEQDAWFFIPKDSTIVGYAEALKKERNHVIEDDQDDLLDETKQNPDLSDDTLASLFSVISTTARQDDVIYDASSFSKAELEDARKIAAQLDMPHLNPVAVAKILRFARKDTPAPQPQVVRPTVQTKRATLEQQKREFRRRGGKISRAIASLIEASNGRHSYEELHRILNRTQDITTVDECTLEQLEQRVKILNAWKESYHDGTWREFAPKRYLRSLTGTGSI